MKTNIYFYLFLFDKFDFITKNLLTNTLILLSNINKTTQAIRITFSLMSWSLTLKNLIQELHFYECFQHIIHSSHELQRIIRLQT